MFKSKTRPVIYTQYEHGRLAGTLARLWGNTSFARPALDFAAFADGVALHDWAYGINDNLPAGEVRVTPWPFSVPTISGIVYAFERQGYPEELNPIIVPFNIQ